MTDAQRIHLSGPPPACASCYQQSVERQHVDFGAAYDGPIVEGESNVALATTVSIDDLIICEECLQVAAGLLGYTKDSEAAAEVDALLEQVADARQRVAEAVAYIKKMDAEIEARESFAEIMKPSVRSTRKPKDPVDAA